MILKLHISGSGTCIYVNFDNVTEFAKANGQTNIFQVNNTNEYMAVKETPEEIMSMLTVQTD